MSALALRKSDFTTLTWVLIPVAIALDIAVGSIVLALRLPVYLDSIGTVLVAAVAGPWAGALTGALSNIIWGTFAPDALPWFPVGAAIGFTAGVLANLKLFRSWPKIVFSGFIISLVAAVVGTPIAVYLFGGITGSGSTFITAFLLQSGRDLFSAVLSTNFIVEPVDKIVTCAAAYMLTRGMSRRLLARFPRSENVLETAGT